MADNNTANVSTGKGVKGGYWFSAPASDENLAKITDESLKDFDAKVLETLTDAVNLGYISEDGWNESEDRDTEDFKDVNGDVVDSSTSSRVESVAATAWSTDLLSRRWSWVRNRTRTTVSPCWPRVTVPTRSCGARSVARPLG